MSRKQASIRVVGEYEDNGNPVEIVVGVDYINSGYVYFSNDGDESCPIAICTEDALRIAEFIRTEAR